MQSASACFQVSAECNVRPSILVIPGAAFGMRCVCTSDGRKNIQHDHVHNHHQSHHERDGGVSTCLALHRAQPRAPQDPLFTPSKLFVLRFFLARRTSASEDMVRGCLSMTRFAAAVTESTVNPITFCSCLMGPEAPKVIMPTCSPSMPM
mmetsp:Transcript_103222/g.301056  ORF Transcript_103222/g.301056 Transcript_103222/m.301056 type:complete len:150 (-) Transcript_103222:2078-2527(-)